MFHVFKQCNSQAKDNRGMTSVVLHTGSSVSRYWPSQVIQNVSKSTNHSCGHTQCQLDTCKTDRTCNSGNKLWFGEMTSLVNWCYVLFQMCTFLTEVELFALTQFILVLHGYGRLKSSASWWCNVLYGTQKFRWLKMVSKPYKNAAPMVHWYMVHSSTSYRWFTFLPVKQCSILMVPHQAQVKL